MTRHPWTVLAVVGFALLMLGRPGKAGAGEGSRLRFRLRLITEQAGRADWYRRPDGSEAIVFDAVNDRPRRGTELYMADPDGTSVRPLTFGLPMPHGFIGNPASHPTTDQVLVQAAHDDQQYCAWNHPSEGINAALWVLLDGCRRPEEVYRPPIQGAALHPRFSRDGGSVVFAERSPEGEPRWSLRFATPGGERPWYGWSLHVATWDATARGHRRLVGDRLLRPRGPGLYRTLGWTADGRLIFLHGPPANPFDTRAWTCDREGRQVAPAVTDRGRPCLGALPAPDGRLWAVALGLTDEPPPAPPDLDGPPVLPSEVWLLRDGKPIHTTRLNAPRPPLCRTQVTPQAWDPSGERLLLLAEFFHERRPREPRSTLLVLRAPRRR